jgi:hypothetical protein
MRSDSCTVASLSSQLVNHNPWVFCSGQILYAGLGKKIQGIRIGFFRVD